MRSRSVVSARRVVQACALAVVVAASTLTAGGPIGLLRTAEARTAAPATPNRFDPKAASASVLHIPKPARAGTGGRAQPYAPRVPAVPMQPALVPVDPAVGAHLTGSDGVLELEAPAGAVTAADVAGAGGRLSLLARQVLPPSGSSAGGSGHISFGTYLVQLVDAAGRPAARGTRKPITFRLHQDGRAQALDLGRTRVLVNPPLPDWFDTRPPAVLPAPSGGSSPASAARRSSPASGARGSSPAAGVAGPPVQLGRRAGRRRPGTRPPPRSRRRCRRPARPRRSASTRTHRWPRSASRTRSRSG
jgi:hypothetical protein